MPRPLLVYFEEIYIPKELVSKKFRHPWLESESKDYIDSFVWRCNVAKSAHLKQLGALAKTCKWKWWDCRLLWHMGRKKQISTNVNSSKLIQCIANTMRHASLQKMISTQNPGRVEKPKSCTQKKNIKITGVIAGGVTLFILESVCTPCNQLRVGLNSCTSAFQVAKWPTTPRPREWNPTTAVEQVGNYQPHFLQCQPTCWKSNIKEIVW